MYIIIKVYKGYINIYIFIKLRTILKVFFFLFYFILFYFNLLTLFLLGRRNLYLLNKLIKL